MKVTGHLKEPVLEPCPNRDDLQTLVDEKCAAVQCTRPRDVDQGMDCCHFWTAPDNWQTAKIRVDQIDPEKFKYEQYRYQLYAKPANFDCQHGIARLEPVPDRVYNPPVTDIRALRQTRTIPVMPHGAGAVPLVPSNPGGIPEVTFPMTQTTLGQPDVTTACCVPVVPCQQGYQNLTPRVIYGERCQQPPPPGRPLQKLGPQRQDPCVDNAECSQHKQAFENLKVLQQQSKSLAPGSCVQSGYDPAPPQYIAPPAQQTATGCIGVPPVFPQSAQAYQSPYVKSLQLPKPEFKTETTAAAAAANVQDGCYDSSSLYVNTRLEDGLNPRGGIDTACTNVSTFRFQDRVMREFNGSAETRQERRDRLTRMSGAYGAALQPKQSCKRSLPGPKDNIVLQGNGFSWGGYPKSKNCLCYVLERNPREDPRCLQRNPPSSVEAPVVEVQSAQPDICANPFSKVRNSGYF
ncbi:hypothetical protein RRG08_044910 [Elysia crispata]|uniref:Uncharacterized protein n=1 Tax=Elysia crispata TaxID=231223 RepID=A0AAE1DER1_9GAST|nr:hypothetical protein RRG08_044910 [Elysia crispata]